MSYNIYPVVKKSENCTDYKVKINGKSIDMNTARVSAFPLNRRWPGHQRALDQTELINFVSLQTDEALEFEITPDFLFTKVDIRPRSLNIEPSISNGTIRFTLKKAAYFTVEPLGRSRALHVFADPISEYKCDESTVYFGAGEHDAGIIRLTSGQTLFIDEGAVVYGCVRAINAENISIIGRGILDNSKNKEQLLFECHEENNESAINNALREHTVQIEYCDNVLIDGITIRDSLVYNIRPIGCDGLTVKNVKLVGNWRYNSDGIDMHNCKNVLIDNCFIRTFDDCICVKGFDCYYDGDVEKAVHEAMYCNGKAYDVFKNVLVKNCVLWNDWGKCLEIGAETRAEEISDVIFEDCDIIHVTGTALDAFNVDYADVHDILYRNINIEFDAEIPQPQYQYTDDQKYAYDVKDYAPTLIKCLVEFHHEYSSGGKRRGKIRNVRFENICVFTDADQKLSLEFDGYDDTYNVSSITVASVYKNGILQKPSELLVSENTYTKDIKLI